VSGDLSEATRHVLPFPMVKMPREQALCYAPLATSDEGGSAEAAVSCRPVLDVGGMTEHGLDDFDATRARWVLSGPQMACIALKQTSYTLQWTAHRVRAVEWSRHRVVRQ
jgi:hypothetical protein